MRTIRIFCFIVIGILLTAINASAKAIYDDDGKIIAKEGIKKADKPPLEANIMMTGCIGGCLGGVIGLIIGGLFRPPGESYYYEPDLYEDDRGLLIGFSMGEAFGTSVGLLKAGEDNNIAASTPATLGGGMIMSAIGFFLIEIDMRDDGLVSNIGEIGFGVSVFAPYFGAALGFKQTMRYISPSVKSNSALIDCSDGRISLAFPRVYVRPDTFSREGLSQNIDLLRVRF